MSLWQILFTLKSSWSKNVQTQIPKIILLQIEFYYFCCDLIFTQLIEPSGLKRLKMS
jgi:hypothetical protein